MAFASLVGAGATSMPCPEVSSTRRCRRRQRPSRDAGGRCRPGWKRRSGRGGPAPSATSSTSNAPGVSSTAPPPGTATEYRCVQPSRSQGKTMRSIGGPHQLIGGRDVAEDAAGPGLARHTSRPSPVSTLAMRMDQGSPARRASRTARLPVEGSRRNAMDRPSGDHDRLGIVVRARGRDSAVRRRPHRRRR